MKLIQMSLNFYIKCKKCVAILKAIYIFLTVFFLRHNAQNNALSYKKFKSYIFEKFLRSLYY